MTPRGIRWVVAVAAIAASIPGMIFFAMGAWPVVGFLGLDVLALFWALSHTLGERAVREEVTLWPDALSIRHVDTRGHQTNRTFNPFFVRFSPVRDREDRVVALRLLSREGEIEIGKFLHPEDKARFARDFGAALHRARA